MWLNVILAIILLAIFGAIANRIMGGSGGLLHHAFVGGCGFLLSYIIRCIFFPPELHILWIIIMNLAACCVVVWIIRRIRIHLIFKRMRSIQEESEEADACQDKQ